VRFLINKLIAILMQSLTPSIKVSTEIPSQNPKVEQMFVAKTSNEIAGKLVDAMIGDEGKMVNTG
jgi:hypothetical protein